MSHPRPCHKSNQLHCNKIHMILFLCMVRTNLQIGPYCLARSEKTSGPYLASKGRCPTRGTDGGPGTFLNLQQGPYRYPNNPPINATSSVNIVGAEGTLGTPNICNHSNSISINFILACVCVCVCREKGSFCFGS